MTAPDPAAARRLAVFIERLLAPVTDEAHTGIARALLESRHRFDPLDLGFLRLMVNARSATASDYMRLMSLIRAARERVQ